MKAQRIFEIAAEVYAAMGSPLKVRTDDVPGSYYYEYFGFGEEAEAKEFKQRLIEAGLKPGLILGPGNLISGDEAHYVRVG